MSKLPVHMHRLSAIYWEMVDGLVKNGFKSYEAEKVISSFFKQFEPIPRKKVKIEG